MRPLNRAQPMKPPGCRTALSTFRSTDIPDAILTARLDDPDVVISLAHKVIATGTTTFIPTVITASEEKIVRALRTIAEARRKSPLVAYTMPFVQLEGPFISPVDGAVGAHDREYVRPPSLDEFARWQAASGDLVGW